MHQISVANYNLQAMPLINVGRALIDLGHLRKHERRIYLRVVLKNNKPGCSPFLMAKVSDINVQCSASKTAAVKMHLAA